MSLLPPGKSITATEVESAFQPILRAVPSMSRPSDAHHWFVWSEEQATLFFDTIIKLSLGGKENHVGLLMLLARHKFRPDLDMLSSQQVGRMIVYDGAAASFVRLLHMCEVPLGVYQAKRGSSIAATASHLKTPIADAVGAPARAISAVAIHSSSSFSSRKGGYAMKSATPSSETSFGDQENATKVSIDTSAAVSQAIDSSTGSSSISASPKISDTKISSSRSSSSSIDASVCENACEKLPREAKREAVSDMNIHHIDLPSDSIGLYVTLAGRSQFMALGNTMRTWCNTVFAKECIATRTDRSALLASRSSSPSSSSNSAASGAVFSGYAAQRVNEFFQDVQPPKVEIDFQNNLHECTVLQRLIDIDLDVERKRPDTWLPLLWYIFERDALWSVIAMGIRTRGGYHILLDRERMSPAQVDSVHHFSRTHLQPWIAKGEATPVSAAPEHKAATSAGAPKTPEENPDPKKSAGTSGACEPRSKGDKKRAYIAALAKGGEASASGSGSGVPPTAKWFSVSKDIKDSQVPIPGTLQGGYPVAIVPNLREEFAWLKRQIPESPPS